MTQQVACQSHLGQLVTGGRTATDVTHSSIMVPVVGVVFDVGAVDDGDGVAIDDGDGVALAAGANE